MEPDKGSIAFCQAGFLGLILATTSDRTIDNIPRTIYRGVHLSEGKLGEPWQSINPRVVGNIKEVEGQLSLNVAVK
jgi:hypothetical protein